MFRDSDYVCHQPLPVQDSNSERLSNLYGIENKSEILDILRVLEIIAVIVFIKYIVVIFREERFDISQEREIHIE